MKIFRFFLIGLGGLLILISLAIVGLSITRKDLACEEEADGLKKLEAAAKSYETAKTRGKDDDSETIQAKTTFDNARASYSRWQDVCAKSQSSQRFGHLIAGVLGVIGVVMFPLGFIFGRRKSQPSTPTH